ncbi:MAG TPA: FAD-binding protein, partial [Acidimicrobiales bacterium]|nr:FAD-binding protein [Acidimicrobiales bacterium]
TNADQGSSGTLSVPEGESPDNLGQTRLRIAVLVKQVPLFEAMSLGADGRLQRVGLPLEMNPYCRRAVTKGCELAEDSGGTCTVFTLGPPQAEDVLREAVAWGVDRAVHVCDPDFAGSDTLATARALAAALRVEGPFDLVVVGRNSVDGDTGQVGPEIAELLDLPFASGVRELERAGPLLVAKLEHDDGWEQVRVTLPAVISVAERLCEPCKVDAAGRAAVPADRVTRLTALDLGEGPWGEAGSPSKVGLVRLLPHARLCRVGAGDVPTQVNEAVSHLAERGALGPHGSGDPPSEAPSPSVGTVPTLTAGAQRGPIVGVLLEEGRPSVAAELLGAASELAHSIGGSVTAIAPVGVDPRSLGPLGADQVVAFEGSGVADDVSMALIGWVGEVRPWALLAPSTAFGREVAARTAAAFAAGLVGDAIGVEARQGRLIAPKPAFSGALVAEITSSSDVQMATIRPGVLPILLPRSSLAALSTRAVEARGRVRVDSRERNDDIEVLARAEVVIGLGSGVTPDDFELFSPLASMLGAELAATRKVTDKGWAPRSRQVGITGRAISPRLYLAFGLSGKFNHMVGVRSAGSILAVNSDPAAPVFEHCDVGIVGDWREVLPVLEAAIHRQLGQVRPDPAPVSTPR